MESMELKNLISSSETVDVYRVGDMAIKLFKEGCRKTMPLYEALTHSRVEDTGLNIPIIREVSVINNRWAIQMDLIEGKTLADIMKEDPDHMDDYLNQMVDIQLEIHSKKVPKLSKLKDKLIRQINELDCIDDVKKCRKMGIVFSRDELQKIKERLFSASEKNLAHYQENFDKQVAQINDGKLAIEKMLNEAIN